MTCPVCGGKTKVTDSKADKEAVCRRRICEECSHVFFTVEQEAESPERFRELRQLYDKRRRLC